MMPWLAPFFKLLHRVLDYVEAFRHTKKTEERQERMDELHRDPADAFANHFGGVRDKPSQDEPSSKTDTGGNPGGRWDLP